MKSRSKFCHICSDVVTEDLTRPSKSDLLDMARDEQVCNSSLTAFSNLDEAVLIN
jgi:hypothetical protein